MTVYTHSTSAARGTWPDPIESVWQILPANPIGGPGYQRPDLGVSDRLFIGAVVNLPKTRRPWGCLTWLAAVFATSRTTIYAIGERTRTALLARPGGHPAQLPAPTESGAPATSEPGLKITPNRLARTILTLLMPGGVSERTVADCLQVALDQARSTGSISELLHTAGERAGKILDQVDHSVLGPVVQARDELFTGRAPNRLMVEPHSLVITGLYATADRDAETWGWVLLLTQDRQVHIRGLAEDGCIPYAASCRLAGLDAAIQKDVWHPLHDAQQVVQDVEREALQALTAAQRLERRLRKHWSETDFVEWATATERAERLLYQSDRLRFWRGCLWEAVEIVDVANGEIRDRAINGWVLAESLAGLNDLDHPRIQKLTERLQAQAPELLTFLDDLVQPVADWQARLAQHFTEAEWAAFFQASVARLWRLEHALRNGHAQFRAATVAARQLIAEFVADDPAARRLAEDLLTLLERTVSLRPAVPPKPSIASCVLI